MVGEVVLRGAARVAVPAGLRSRVLGLAHEVHQGVMKTKQGIRELYWWPGLDSEVEELVRTCQNCSTADKTATPRRALMQPVPFPSEPWAKLGLDFIGPITGGRPDQRYVIVHIDYHCKRIEMRFCAHPTTEDGIMFLEKLASCQGYQDEVVSDCGSVLMSDRFACHLRSVGIKHVRASPYHPQASGQVECTNKVVKDALQTTSLERVDWAEYIQLFLLNYRSAIQATTGRRAPARAAYAHQTSRRSREVGELSPDQESRTRELLSRVQGKQHKQKAYFARQHLKVPEFKVGNGVRRKLPQL